jgi:hypothetical protein
VLKQLFFLSAFAAATSVVTLSQISPAHADAGGPSFSCSNAKTAMAQAHEMLPTTPSATTDVDKDFTATELQVAKAQVVIGHVMAKCSKTAAYREAALEMAREAEARMRLFRNEGTSL